MRAGISEADRISNGTIRGCQHRQYRQAFDMAFVVHWIRQLCVLAPLIGHWSVSNIAVIESPRASSGSQAACLLAPQSTGLPDRSSDAYRVCHLGCQVGNIVRFSPRCETGTRIQCRGDRVFVASDHHGYDVHPRKEQVLWSLLDREWERALRRFTLGKIATAELLRTSLVVPKPVHIDFEHV
jgi:hypothetical protein